MLHLHRAERADALVAALGAIVVEPLDDVMAAEVVAVPTRGVERWLTQRLSARLGTGPGRADVHARSCEACPVCDGRIWNGWFDTVG